MSDKLLILLNDNYKVLELLYNNTIKQSCVSAITQVEVAKILGFGKMKVNGIFKVLIDVKLVYQYENYNGKYVLSDEAVEIIKKMKSIK